MVKTKTKTPTLDSVRKVKSGVTELVLQNQKLKKKCRKLKKKVAKLETTSKTTFRNDTATTPRSSWHPGTFTEAAGRARLDYISLEVSKLTPYQQNIWRHTLSMFKTLDITVKQQRPYCFLKFIHNLPSALMSRHAKTVAAGFIHSSVKPELNKRVMQEKIGVSVPTISQVSRIINLI
uniref:Uncharacterized protein n=1 Tax=viral metagenome TaxID=1070528 RepID=A0A6C0J0H0_9ZZZZ